MNAAPEPVTAALSAEERVRFEAVLCSESLTAPVAAGETVGEGIFSLNGEELVRVPLLLAQSVERNTASGSRGIFG